MRFTRLLAIVVLAIVSSTFVCHAQYENYYKVDGTKFIIANPGAELYPLPESYNYAIMSRTAFRSSYRDFIDIREIKSKTIRKSEQLRVVRYTNVTKSFNFDAYIVEYKDKLWVLRGCDVKTNTLLDLQNDKLALDKEGLESAHNDNIARQQELSDRRVVLSGRLDSLSAYYAQMCADSISYYKNLEVRIPEIRDSLILVAEREEQARVDKEFDDWCKTQPASTKAAAKAISIIYAGLEEPNSVGGCDYTFTYTNYSPKTIKYLYWTGTAYNAVNDPAYCEIRRTVTYTGQDVGPIEHGESGGGGWDCVVYNYSAAYMKLSKVQIVYMDGSSITIGAADILRILDAPSREVSVDSWAIRNSVISSSECRKKVSLWQDRQRSVQNKKTYSSYSDRWTELEKSSYNNTINTIKELMSQENSLQAETDKIQKDIETFDKFLNFCEFAYSEPQSTTDKSSSTYSNNSTTSSVKKDPFVTLGIEGSLEGFNSVSTGWGLTMRFGRFDSMFNCIIGAKYQYTGYKKSVSYSYTENYSYYYSYADYSRKVNQIVFPITLNWNILRDYYSCYIGIGYEFGVLLSDKYVFDYDFGDPFNESDFYEHSHNSLVNLCVPARSLVLQFGTSGRHWDWKVYYKFNKPGLKFPKKEVGAVGMAFTYYF